MKVLIIGITGGVGRRVAERLTAYGHKVTGLVRREEQAAALGRRGIDAAIGDVAKDTPERLAEAIRDKDIVLFTAGAGG